MTDFSGLCLKLQHRYQWHTLNGVTMGSKMDLLQQDWPLNGLGKRPVEWDSCSSKCWPLSPFHRRLPPPTSSMQPLLRRAFSSPRLHGCGLLPQQTGRWLEHILAWVRGARGTWRTTGNSEGLGYQFWDLNKLPLLQKDPSCGAKSWQCTGKTELGIIDL